MVTVIQEYPYNGNNKLVRHYAMDENGVKYYISQVETGIEYAEAIDVYPSRYAYVATDKKIEEPKTLEPTAE